jgi:hypothetical protein
VPDAPEWRHLYNARNEYKLKDMSPTSWNRALRDIHHDWTVLAKGHQGELTGLADHFLRFFDTF